MVQKEVMAGKDEYIYIYIFCFCAYVEDNPHLGLPFSMHVTIMNARTSPKSMQDRRDTT